MNNSGKFSPVEWLKSVTETQEKLKLKTTDSIFATYGKFVKPKDVILFGLLFGVGPKSTFFVKKVEQDPNSPEKLLFHNNSNKSSISWAKDAWCVVRRKG